MQETVIISAFNLQFRLHIIQGTNITITGTYRGMISLNAANVDLSSLTVSIAAQPVSSAGSVSGQIVPYDGYFPFIHSSMLHIKVFKGPNTPNPEDTQYSISYRVTDGTAGNITQLVGLQKFRQDLFDSGTPTHRVSYVLTNDDISNGLDAPSRYDLLNQLREKFWVTTNVSSVPEYTAWLRAQPEVGDVLVISDYEKWKRNPAQEIAEVTGVVTVYLMGRDGLPIPDGTRGILDDRLSLVKDIAVIQYLSFEYVQHTILVRFTSVSSESLFIQDMSLYIRNFYVLSWLIEHNMSLFEDLDISLIYRNIPTMYSAYGVEIIPYHSRQFYFYGDPTTSDEDLPDEIRQNYIPWRIVDPFKVDFYDGEELNGSYEWVGKYQYAEDVEPFSIRFVEVPADVTDMAANIYQMSNEIGIDTGIKLGERIRGVLNAGECVIDIQNAIRPYTDAGGNPATGFLEGDILRCFWPLKNKGLASINKDDAARSLMQVRVQPSTQAIL